MEGVSFLINFIKVDRMHLIYRILTDLIFQVKYIKRHGFLLLMSQFQFHHVFSGTPVRLKQIWSKTNQNTLKLKVLNHCNMVKTVKPAVCKKTAREILARSTHP